MPVRDANYLNQLEFDLKKASEHLYDFTDGQVALGEIVVNQDADNWGYAHIVVHANNGLRPYAYIGGIVLTETLDADHNEIFYAPGQVHMGSIWNRYGTPGQSAGGRLAHHFGP